MAPITLVLLLLTTAMLTRNSIAVELRVPRDKTLLTGGTWGVMPEKLSIPEAAKQKSYVEQIATHPRAYLFHNFLSETERKHLIRLAAPNMRRSMVVDKDGKHLATNSRTSAGTFLRRLQDPVVDGIEKRISLWSHIPLENQEDIQVMRYVAGQSYAAHYDSAYDTTNNDVIRLATFLMYLSDVEEGGETAFPSSFAEWTDPHIPDSWGTPSKCARGSVYARAKAGDALLFFSYFPNKSMDISSIHTGCPVIKGVKWSAAVWLHLNPFRPEELAQKPSSFQIQHDPGLCQDYDAQCAKWAAEDQCKLDPEFMVGGSFASGVCRKSCKVCTPCKRGDWDCINQNRKTAGFLELDKQEMEWLGVGDYFENA